MKNTELNRVICIVEDNPSIAKLFATILKKSGYSTVEFHSAKSAIDWITQNKPDCILADILLPDYNGTELLTIIRKLPDGDKIPIIAITGLAQPNDEKKLLELGFDGYLSKPIDISTFAEYIDNVIKLKNT